MYTVHLCVLLCCELSVTHIAHAATVSWMCYRNEVGCRDDTMPKTEGATRYRIESV